MSNDDGFWSESEFHQWLTEGWPQEKGDLQKWFNHLKALNGQPVGTSAAARPLAVGADMISVRVASIASVAQRLASAVGAGMA